MPEIPASKILDRDISLAATSAVRAAGRPALREVVDECIRVFQRCSNTARGTDEHIGQLFPLLQLAEHLDGVEIALDGASATAAGVLLRAAFESLLTVEWVAKDKPLRYGAAYVVAEIHRRIAGLEQFTPGTDRRKQAEEKMRSDALGATVDFPTFAEAPNMIVRLQKLLKAKHIAEAAAAYDTDRKKSNKVEWYSLWGGPKTIEQLATRLERGAQYEFLYRGWSRSVHGTDLMRQLTSQDDAAAVRVFRDGSELAKGYTFGLAFGLDAIKAILGRYRPDELNSSYKTWYNTLISKPLQRLSR
jgi:hypothetical protein